MLHTAVTALFLRVTEVESCSTLELRRTNTLLWDLDPTALKFFCPLCHRSFSEQETGSSLPLGLLPLSLFPSFPKPSRLGQGQSFHLPVSQLGPETRRCVRGFLTGEVGGGALVETPRRDPDSEARRLACPVGPDGAPATLGTEQNPTQPSLSPQHQGAEIQPPAQPDREERELQQRGRGLGGAKALLPAAGGQGPLRPRARRSAAFPPRMRGHLASPPRRLAAPRLAGTSRARGGCCPSRASPPLARSPWPVPSGWQAEGFLIPMFCVFVFTWAAEPCPSAAPFSPEGGPE